MRGTALLYGNERRPKPPGEHKAHRGIEATIMAMTEPAFALPTAARRSLVRAARGRPGWIVLCAALAAEPRYWHQQQLRAHVLALDTEMRLRALNFSDPIAPISD